MSFLPLLSSPPPHQPLDRPIFLFLSLEKQICLLRKGTIVDATTEVLQPISNFDEGKKEIQTGCHCLTWDLVDLASSKQQFKEMQTFLQIFGMNQRHPLHELAVSCCKKCLFTFFYYYYYYFFIFLMKLLLCVDL